MESQEQQTGHPAQRRVTDFLPFVHHYHLSPTYSFHTYHLCDDDLATLNFCLCPTSACTLKVTVSDLEDMKM